MNTARIGHVIGGVVLVSVLLAVAGPVRAATTYCVWTNGNDAYAGTNWNQPFKTITNAVRVAVDGDTVLVTNGTYTYSATGLGTGAGIPIRITNGITLRSVNGYTVTIIKPGSGYNSGGAAVIVNHTNAVLDGFRITGSTAGYVGDVSAGGVSLTYGLVQNCWIDNNNGYRGGGVSLNGAKGAATAYQATVRNCMIVGNSASDVAGGGGVEWGANYAGVADSCTILKNTGLGGAGVRNLKAGGVIQNSIVHGNSASPSKNFNWTASMANVSNCCITRDYTTGGTGNLTNDPSFMDWNGGDYHLSPVAGAGVMVLESLPGTPVLQARETGKSQCDGDDYPLS